MKFDWIIYGNNIASLVLADELGKQGKPTLLIQPWRGWGGIFSGIEFNGTKYDLGMTNFEFELFGGERRDVQNYDYDRRNDLSDFVVLVKEYVGQYVDFHALTTPQMVLDGKLMGDIVITNQFDLIKNLPAAEAKKIETELRQIVSKPNALHPRNKKDNPELMANASLYDASMANHGPTFHSLIIENMCQKILGVSTREVSSLYHRGAWVPLYYPETLLSQFSESKQTLKPTIFHYVDGSHFGIFIEKLLKSVQQRKSVTVLAESKCLGVSFGEGAEIKTDKGYFQGQNLAWCGEISGLKKAIFSDQVPEMADSKDQKADIDIFFLKFKKEGVGSKFSVLLDADVNSPFYRITNQTECSGIDGNSVQVLMECNSKAVDFELTPENIRKFIQPYLIKYGLQPDSLLEIYHKRAPGALTVPKKRVVESIIGDRDFLLSKFKNLRLLGASTGLWSNTFNDQVIQALKVSSEKGISQ